MASLLLCFLGSRGKVVKITFSGCRGYAVKLQFRKQRIAELHMQVLSEHAASVLCCIGLILQDGPESVTTSHHASLCSTAPA